MWTVYGWVCIGHVYFDTQTLSRRIAYTQAISLFVHVGLD